MERQYVGIDLHRRSATIYRMSKEGDILGLRTHPEPALRARPGRGRSRTRFPRWSSSPPMAGTGPPICSKTSAPTSTSPMRSGTTGGRAG